MKNDNGSTQLAATDLTATEQWLTQLLAADEHGPSLGQSRWKNE
ncbi:MAG: hypothetical protein ABJC74_08430 [Gemmatimonadota bacterium]